MHKRAWIFIYFVFTAAALLGSISFLSFDKSRPEWFAFALLTILTTSSQLFKSEAPSHQLYHPALIFIFAGVILLQPALFVLLILISHSIEWLKERLSAGNHLKDWYIQPFNISMHLITGSAAYAVYQILTQSSGNFNTPLSTIAGLLAAAVYVLINHVLVGEVLVLARGVSWKQSEILNLENLSTDYVMLVTGFVMAYFIKVNVWLMAPALTPMYLIYRALAVPYLKHQASTDPKTGLWNPKHFMEMFESELSRSNRFGRPITVVVGDLDLLRNINNVYGHLAGDAVLIGVAKLLKDSVREYDIVSRFGGEEFAILMPEILPQEAYHRVEAIRKKLETAEFQDPTSPKMIKATMSFGIAGGIAPNMDAKELIHQADLAVYQSKVKGRNLTSAFSEVMQNFPGELFRIDPQQPEPAEIGQKWNRTYLGRK